MGPLQVLLVSGCTTDTGAVWHQLQPHSEHLKDRSPGQCRDAFFIIRPDPARTLLIVRTLNTLTVIATLIEGFQVRQ